MDARTNEEFTQHLMGAVKVAEKLGYRPHRFKAMLNADGGYQTVNKILASGKPSDGFTRLLELRRVDLTCEAIIVESLWRHYFDEDLLARAEHLLHQVEYPFKRYQAVRLSDAPNVHAEPREDDGSKPEVRGVKTNAAVNRKQFLESQGATCRNWTWSWSFINEAEKVIIFGAWDKNSAGNRALILSEDWEISRRGRRQPGYSQAREHIRLVEEEGFELKTFPMTYAEVDEEGDVGPAKIEDFVPKLSNKSLIRIGNSWYASDDELAATLPEEIESDEGFVEGSAKSVRVNAYERSPEARAKCLAHYGYACVVCSFDFESTYGALGRNYIHVHHVLPLSEIRGEYTVDPVKDLVPICPNCHAMIHVTRPCLSIEQLQRHLADNRPD